MKHSPVDTAQPVSKWSQWGQKFLQWGGLLALAIAVPVLSVNQCVRRSVDSPMAGSVVATPPASSGQGLPALPASPVSAPIEPPPALSRPKPPELDTVVTALLASKERKCVACILDTADLRAQDLRRAKLAEASLVGANLQAINLIGADLQRTFLMEANLQGAYLNRANLQGAYLMRANLEFAQLSGADLTDADLSDARLHQANLTGAKLCRTVMSNRRIANRDCK